MRHWRRQGRDDVDGYNQRPPLKYRVSTILQMKKEISHLRVNHVNSISTRQSCLTRERHTLASSTIQRSVSARPLWQLMQPVSLHEVGMPFIFGTFPDTCPAPAQTLVRSRNNLTAQRIHSWPTCHRSPPWLSRVCLRTDCGHGPHRIRLTRRAVDFCLFCATTWQTEDKFIELSSNVGVLLCRGAQLGTSCHRLMKCQ